MRGNLSTDHVASVLCLQSQHVHIVRLPLTLSEFKPSPSQHNQATILCAKSPMASRYDEQSIFSIATGRKIRTAEGWKIFVSSSSPASANNSTASCKVSTSQLPEYKALSYVWRSMATTDVTTQRTAMKMQRGPSISTTEKPRSPPISQTLPE